MRWRDGWRPADQDFGYCAAGEGEPLKSCKSGPRKASDLHLDTSKWWQCGG